MDTGWCGLPRSFVPSVIASPEADQRGLRRPVAQRHHHEKVFTFDFFEALEDDDTEAVRCSVANHQAADPQKHHDAVVCVRQRRVT